MWIVIIVLRIRYYIRVTLANTRKFRNEIFYTEANCCFTVDFLVFFHLVTGKWLLKERALLYQYMMGLRKATSKHSSLVINCLIPEIKDQVTSSEGDRGTTLMQCFFCSAQGQACAAQLHQPNTKTCTRWFPSCRLFYRSIQGLPSHLCCWLDCS